MDRHEVPLDKQSSVILHSHLLQNLDAEVAETVASFKTRREFTCLANKLARWSLQLQAVSNDEGRFELKIPNLKSSKTTVKKCEICGDDFVCETYRAHKAKCCSVPCRQKYISRVSAPKRGAMQRRIRGDRKGYVKFLGRHEHRVVAEQMLGRPLAEGEIVHHRDGNKQNNSPENLEVIYQSEHTKLHFKMMMKRRKEVAGF